MEKKLKLVEKMLKENKSEAENQKIVGDRLGEIEGKFNSNTVLIRNKLNNMRDESELSQIVTNRINEMIVEERIEEIG